MNVKLPSVTELRTEIEQLVQTSGRMAQQHGDVEEYDACVQCAAMRVSIGGALTELAAACTAEEWRKKDRELVHCPAQAVTEVACANNCEICQGAGKVTRVAAEVRSDPEFMAGVREGMKACAEGRMIPWSELKRKYDLTTGESR